MRVRQGTGVLPVRKIEVVVTRNLPLADNRWEDLSHEGFLGKFKRSRRKGWELQFLKSLGTRDDPRRRSHTLTSGCENLVPVLGEERMGGILHLCVGTTDRCPAQSPAD